MGPCYIVWRLLGIDLGVVEGGSIDLRGGGRGGAQGCSQGRGQLVLGDCGCTPTTALSGRMPGEPGHRAMLLGGLRVEGGVLKPSGGVALLSLLLVVSMQGLRMLKHLKNGSNQDKD